MDKILNATKDSLKTDVVDFKAGDTISVGVKVTEGNRSRVQLFDGVVISKSSGSGTSKTFTVRKISNGVGVERIFPYHSPIIDSIKVLKKGKVRRAKLYYLRDRTGKSARIAEKIKKKIGIDVDVQPEQAVEEKVVLPAEEKATSETPKVEAKKESTKEKK